MVQCPTGKPIKIAKLSGTPRRILPDLTQRNELDEISTRHRTVVGRKSKLAAPVYMARKPRLYLAYGSNLSKRGMRMRAPDAISKGTMLLTDARLVFRGVADVEFVPGYAVPLGIWSISARDERALDSYEGVATGFYEKHELAISKSQTALIYTMLSDGVYPPAQGYYDTIRQGYRDFGLDESFLELAMRESFKEKDPSELEIARRLRQRATERYRKLVAMPEDIMRRKLERQEQFIRRGSILEDETPAERFLADRKPF